MNSKLIQQERIKPEFTKSVTPKVKPTRKRPAPYSIRFSDEEREQLNADADGVPFGTYIKERVFENKTGAKNSSRSIVKDYELLAQVLAALGQSDVFANLDSIARQIEAGNLTLSPEAEYEIGLTCACVLQMRDDLVYALGLRTELEL